MQWAPASYAGGASAKTNKHVTVCQGQLQGREGGWHLSLVTCLLWPGIRLALEAAAAHAAPRAAAATFQDSSLPIL